MKKILFVCFAVLSLIISNTSKLHAQAPAPRPLIWGTSPFQDSLWSIDTTTWQVVNRLGPSLAGFTITGMTGLAIDPTTFEVYVIMKLSAVTGRVLGKINLQTGVCTQVGNLGDQFSSICFREDGQLFGVTGNGATVPETLYLIDKTNGTKTLAASFSPGDDGEVICYNKDNNLFYRWSGNSTVSMQAILSTAPYTATNIPISGTAGGETFGTLYLGNNKFLNSTILNNFRRVNTSGVYGANPVGSNPDDLRGLVQPPVFTYSDDSICEGSTFHVGAGGLQLFENVIYHWGDGNTDTTGIVGTSHTYTTTGTFTVSIELASGSINTHDTVTTYTIVVLGVPNPSIVGATTLCPNSSFYASAVSVGTQQWYKDGIAIPAETNDSLLINAAGHYNVYQTNILGCADSAAVALVVVSVPNPVLNLGVDSAFCGNTILDAANAGASFFWNDSTTLQTLAVTTTGMYYVMVTDSNNCSSSDSINITINPNPVVSLGADTANCLSLLLDAGSGFTAYLWSDTTTAQTTTITTSGTYAVFVTDSNGCIANDSINVIIHPNPILNLGADTSGCGFVTIDASFGNPAFVSYLWCDGSMGPVVTFNFSGTCAVTAADSNGCIAFDTINFIVHFNPTVNAAASATLVCTDDADVILTGSPNGGTFSGPGVSGTIFDPSIGAGVQTVIYNYTDTNGCSGSATIQITVDPCVGIVEQTTVSLLQVYPNPANGIINLQLNENETTVRVLNAAGQLVGVYTYNTAGTFQVDGSDWAAGVYTMQAVSGNTVSQVRLVVTK
ncbi:MAG: T9SS type A sorting domain-containing protein [Bacteroidia bacterium]